jgi:hypothetical protein
VTTSEKNRFKKSSFTGEQTDCVELAHAGMVRDSKDPHGPILAVPLPALLATVKAGRIRRP